MRYILLLFTIFFNLARLDDETEKIMKEFVGMPIKIMFSKFSHYHLAKLNNDGDAIPFIGVNKYIDAERYGYDDRARINKNKDGYLIEVGNKGICIDGKDKISVCGKNQITTWEFKKQTFGFTISFKDKCLTKSMKDGMKLSDCNFEEEQLFDFKQISDLTKCDALFSNDENGAKSKTKDSDLKDQDKKIGNINSIPNTNLENQNKKTDNIKYIYWDPEKREFVDSSINIQNKKTDDIKSINWDPEKREFVNSININKIGAMDLKIPENKSQTGRIASHHNINTEDTSLIFNTDKRSSTKDKNYDQKHFIPSM